MLLPLGMPCCLLCYAILFPALRSRVPQLALSAFSGPLASRVINITLMRCALSTLSLACGYFQPHTVDTNKHAKSPVVLGSDWRCPDLTTSPSVIDQPFGQAKKPTVNVKSASRPRA
jgi:hypothetical protein